MSKRVRCKFFAHGACLKGEHCEFSHDWEDPPNNICTYYQKGICSYGSRCRYQHVRPSCSNTGASSSSAIARRSSASHLGRVTQPARNEDNRVTSILGVPPEARNENNRATPILGVPPELSSPSTSFFPSGKPARDAVSGKLKLLENAEGIRPPRHGRPADRPLCSFVVTGVCPHGDKCPHIHGDLCPSCGKHCLHPFRPHQREEHLKLCEKKQKHLEALKRSQEVECSVCLDHVLSKATAAERKFGLLSECDHPFCISCIRNWRSSSPSSGVDVNTALRACPICRKVSYFVIPSVIWYSSKEEKQEIVDNYKLKLSSIDCKHFNFGNGNCPFGTSCFYKHTVKPGSYMWRYHRPPPRRRATRRSNVVDMDTFYDMFEHLIGEDAPDIFDAEDFFDEDLTPMDMALLLMQMNVGSSDDSSEEDNYLF